MDQLSLGDVHIHRIEEWQGVFLSPQQLFTGFDEADYGFIKACAFAGDSYRQQFYRVRINELRADQQRVREGLTGNMLEDEVSYRIIMAIDRSVQAYATLSHRGRRDLPVAFAPKGVLQDQTPPTDEELDARPELVKTMSVRPPTGAGRVRLLAIEGIDLQACGGTHVARTGEIGRVECTKIENKGKMNRRFIIALA